MRKFFLFLLISTCSLFAQVSGGARLLAGPGTPPASLCTQPALGSVYTQTDAAAGQANWHCRYVAGSYVWELQGGGGGASTSVANTWTQPQTFSQGVSASNILSPLQEQHPYALRSTLTKVALLALNQGGYPTYTTPQQIMLVQAGDSTAGFHTGEVWCTLAAQYGLAGYVGSGSSGNIQLEGFNCPGNAPGFTYSGGAFQIDGSVHAFDYTRFPEGVGFVIPAGGCVTTSSFKTSSKQMVFYVQEPGAGTISILTNNNGAGFVSQFSGSAANASTVGAVWSTDFGTAAPYELQVCAATATVNVYVVGQIDTTSNGVVYVGMGRGGLSLPDATVTPTAITTPWYAAIDPDLVMFEMKTNGTSNSSCDQSTTAAPSTFVPYSTWWSNWTGKWLAGNTNADFLIIGGYDVGVSNDPNGCIAKHNTVYASWAATNKQSYFDLFSQTPNALQQTLGWIDTSVHQTPVGQVAEGNLLVQYLGIHQWPTALAAQNVNAPSYVTAPLHIIGGSTPTLQCYTTGDAANVNYDCISKVGRGFKFTDSGANYYGYLGSGTSAFAQTNNFLPPFQVGNTSNSASSQWIAHNTTTGFAGIYNGPAASTPKPWAASNLFYGSTATSGCTGAQTFDLNNFQLRCNSISGNVTSQTFTNTTTQVRGQQWMLFQGATPFTWTWSATTAQRGAAPLPAMANCIYGQSMQYSNNANVFYPVSIGALYCGSTAGQGDQKTIGLNYANGSGVSANTDLTGELTLSAATTASYTFGITVYNNHPECWAQPQFDITSGNRYWITYTAATSFTVNFASAVTGTVSYGCAVRN